MRLKLLFITIALFVGVRSSYGQISEGFESGLPTAYNATLSNVTLGSGMWQVQNVIEGTTDVNSGTKSAQVKSATGAQIITPTLSGGVGVISFYITASTTSGAYQVNISTDDGANWSAASGSPFTISTTKTLKSITVNNSSVNKIQIYRTGATLYLDDISVTSMPSGPTSITSGDWNVGSTWSTGSVPTSTDNVTISTAHTVYTSTALTRTVTTTVNGNFQLNAGGWANGTNFTYGATGGLYFNNTSSYGVNNTDVFWPTTNGPFNVNVLQGGVTLNSANRTVAGTFATTAGVTLSSSTLTLDGTAQINAGGFFYQSPIYGASSTLIYNTGVTAYGRGYEWQALGVGTIGTTPGYPNNVQLSGGTTLNYNNGTPLAKAIAGNLTIDSGSNFYMDYGGGASGGALTVAGNVTNNGNFTLGNANGDDLKLGGNFINTGTFNGNNRAIFFTKNGTQTVSSVAALTIPYVVFQPVSGSTTVQLLSDVTVSASNAGNAISFSSATDIFDLNGKTLTIGTVGVANVISGSGTFKGSTTSNLTLLGTGSIGTLTFASNLNLGTLAMNRQAATVGCTMGSNVTINTALNLTNGIVDLGANTMTLASGCSNIFGDSANSFVISDVTATGNLRKNIIANGSFTFPIGDRVISTDGSQYSPATINFTAANYSSAWVALAIEDSIEPNLNASTDFITRYWNLTSSGITSATYNFTGTYLPADISGTETNCISGRYSTSNSTWANGTNLVSGANTISLTGLTSATGALTDPNHFSAGNRNKEINIKGYSGSTNDIASGSTTANGLNNTLFAATPIGSSSTKDYEIQNIGIAALNLTGTPIVSIGGANPGDFTVTSVPSTPIIGGTSTTFVITFSPTYAGVRTAIVSIANDDSDENPYTFLIQGTGNCNPAATNTITPTSGPIGTEVTITATANNLTGATATFNGTAATPVTFVSSTQIKVIVPSGATSGNLVTTNANGCQATNAFTVVDNKANSCQGGNVASDLFISEVTDESFGSMTYIEIFNGTGVSIDLASYDYRIKVYNNGLGTVSCDLPLSGTIANNSVFVLSIGGGSSTEAAGVFPNQTEDGCFAINNNDNIRLFKGASQKDQWGFPTDTNLTGVGNEGYTFRRKNTATPIPSTTFVESDWVVIDADDDAAFDSAVDYSDIGVYNFISGTSPTVTLHPSYTPTCKATSLTVAGTEGYTGGNPLAYKWLYADSDDADWTEITDDTNYTGSSTATLSIANISTVINYQYYCQIRENTNTCYTASNAVKITDGGTATWNGSWTNGPPTLDKLVIINADYNTTTNSSFSACSVVVNTGKNLTITADEYVKIQNDLTNNGTVYIENDGSLVQVNDSGVNTGSITYDRQTITIVRNTDYTYWSSPVSPQTLYDLSPYTLDGMFYSYDSTIGLEGDWKQESSGTPMASGKGYIVRGPEPLVSPPPAPSQYTASFEGIPNNGVYPINGVIADRSYLLGNPYPSALDADKFLDTNSGVLDGTLYFWTHKTEIQDANNITGVDEFGNLKAGSGAYAYTSDDYASYNGVGGAAASGSPVPTGKIAATQGFFASSNATIIGANEIIFNNSMRVDNSGNIMDNSQFFKTRSPKTKTAAIEKHRIWLNLTNAQGAFKQTLIGYITNATNEYDSRFDGESFDANEFVDFYSVNQDKNLVIQGRSLPFNENDEVPLGYRSAIEGAFTINIDQTDGLLTNQAVFLEDKLTNTTYDLRSGAYTFNTAVGTFNDRFILRYTNKTLSNKDFEALENQVLVSNKNKQIKVNSKVETIDKVSVYDLLGRQLFKKEKVNSNELTIPNLVSSHEPLLVKVSLQNGQIVTKKIVY